MSEICLSLEIVFSPGEPRRRILTVYISGAKREVFLLYYNIRLKYDWKSQRDNCKQ